MTLSQTLIKSAAIGTSNSLPDSANEAYILRQAGLQAFKRLAGYQVSVNQKPDVAPSKADDKSVVSQQTTTYLQNILFGEHRKALAEWCRHVAVANKHAPYEYVPHLLAITPSKGQLKLYIAAVVGKRGRWIAEQRLDLETPHWTIPSTDVDITKLVSVDEEAEAKILEMYYTDNTRRSAQYAAMMSFYLLYTPWSNTLAENFVHTAFEMLIDRPPPSLYRLIEGSVYRLPYLHVQYLMNLIKRKTITMGKILTRFQKIHDFRYEMQQAIELNEG